MSQETHQGGGREKKHHQNQVPQAPNQPPIAPIPNPGLVTPPPSPRSAHYAPPKRQAASLGPSLCPWNMALPAGRDWILTQAARAAEQLGKAAVQEQCVIDELTLALFAELLRERAMAAGRAELQEAEKKRLEAYTTQATARTARRVATRRASTAGGAASRATAGGSWASVRVRTGSRMGTKKGNTHIAPLHQNAALDTQAKRTSTHRALSHH